MSMVNLGPIALRGFNINREYQTFKITELDETKKYFLIGDWHLFHTNIIKYANRPANFQDILISNHNSAIQDDDILIFCGDIAHGMWHVSKDTEVQKKILKDEIAKFNGKKILILGNHDDFGIDYYNEIFDYVFDFMVDYDIFINHYPIEKTKYNTPMQDEMMGVYNLHFLGYNVVHGHTHNRDNINSNIRHFNVSCEYIDYTPIELDVVRLAFDMNFMEKGELDGW